MQVVSILRNMYSRFSSDLEELSSKLMIDGSIKRALISPKENFVHFDIVAPSWTYFLYCPVTRTIYRSVSTHDERKPPSLSLLLSHDNYNSFCVFNDIRTNFNNIHIGTSVVPIILPIWVLPQVCGMLAIASKTP